MYAYKRPCRFCIGWIIGRLKYKKNTFKNVGRKQDDEQMKIIMNLCSNTTQ